MNGPIIETVCQVMIALLGLTSAWLLVQKNRWGIVVGLLSEPFWFTTTIRNQQWGVFLLAVAYTLIFIHGFYREWLRKPVPPA